MNKILHDNVWSLYKTRIQQDKDIWTNRRENYEWKHWESQAWLKLKQLKHVCYLK